MDMASATIKKLGVSEDLIHKESFYCATKAKKWLNHPQQVYQVKLILNGKEHEVNVLGGEPVLFPALSSGIDIPYSCQSGHCNSCVGRRLSGKIEMSASEGLTEEQLKAGYVCTCVAYPQSEDVVVEFS